jgi:hypothetical protein
MRVSRIAAVGAVLAVLSFASAAGADTKGPIDFEGYTPGPVIGQDSPPWTGAPCAAIDSGVVVNAANSNAPSSFETKSFRMSNAVVSGCFNDAFTPQTANEAGEATAQNSPLSGGTRQPYYETQFTFASYTGGLQPGLSVQVSPDRGDGSRMSYVKMEHTATDLELSFYDVQGVDPPNTSTPCFQCANFVPTSLGKFDPKVPHTVRITMQLVDGPSNDIVKVYVDGNLVHTGGSWEDYYKLDTESSPTPADQVSRTVDSLLIRASGNAQADTAGKGFLFDDVSVTTGPVPTSSPEPGTSPGTEPGGGALPAAPVAATPRFTG